MQHSEFNKILEARLSRTKEVLAGKAGEYATDADRLSNFRDGGIMNHECPEKFLFGLVSKHWIAIRDFIEEIQEGKEPRTIPQWDEKIGDVINYMVLLEALTTERILDGKKK